MNDQEMQVALVANGTLPVAIVGCGENFALIRMDVSADDLHAAIAAARADAKGKGQEYIFAGIMAVINNQAVARCNPGLDAMRVALNAAFAYAQLVADRLKQTPKDDFVQFAERLWSLEDPRKD
jgi:hypothetical protein